jgi:uncharacterized protein (TIGR02145 family)
MRNLLTLFFIGFIELSALAQAPQKFSYQTVIRNASNQLLVGQTVGIKISIIQGSTNGSAVYSETHTPQTNANGLATLEIGGGSLLSGNFANINWANGPFFVKAETDPNGGNNYTITNTSQLLSVPYSLFSGNGILGVSTTGDSLLLGNGTSIIIPGISNAKSTGGQTGITQHSCGIESVHNPAKTYGTMTDQQGNVYKTIIIGSQEWMAENLKTTIYRNGNAIANVTDTAQWQNLTTGAWSYFNNDSQYDCPYSKLYNWYAVVDPRHVCPTGWHVPSDAEWTTLENYLGGSNVAAGKLKSTGTQYWNTPNDANNESGFSGLPAGARYDDGTFNELGPTCVLWSSTEDDANDAWYRALNYYYSFVYRLNLSKVYGFSVRCLKD